MLWSVCVCLFVYVWEWVASVNWSLLKKLQNKPRSPRRVKHESLTQRMLLTEWLLIQRSSFWIFVFKHTTTTSGQRVRSLKPNLNSAPPASTSPFAFLCVLQWDSSWLHTFFGSQGGYVNKEPRHLWREVTFNTHTQKNPTRTCSTLAWKQEKQWSTAMIMHQICLHHISSLRWRKNTQLLIRPTASFSLCLSLTPTLGFCLLFRLLLLSSSFFFNFSLALRNLQA